MVGVTTMKIRRSRRSSGGVLAEAVAVTAFMLPILVFLSLVIVQATSAYIIDRDLQVAAGLAARALAEQGVPKDGQQVTQDIIFSNIKIPGRVVDPSQFTPAPVYDFSANPPTVTVFVQYKSTGVQPVSPIPDPLNLGKLFIVKAQATYRLQS